MTARFPTWRPILLLLVLLPSLLPGFETAPTPAAPVTREDAVLLMIAGSAGVASDAAELTQATGVGLARASAPATADVNEIEVWRQQIQAQCAETRALIQMMVTDAAQQAPLLADLDANCQAQLAALQAQAGKLEQMRQKRRGRPWINLRQLGRWLDKKVLRGAVPEAIKTFVTNGGSVPFGRVLRLTLLANLRRGARQEARTWLSRRLARKGVSPQLLDLAGLPVTPGSTSPTVASQSSDSFLGLPEQGNWAANCRLRTELDKTTGSYLAYWTTVDYRLNLNLGERTFTLAIKAAHDMGDLGGGSTGREIWTSTGQGQLFEDGFLAGTETSTYTIQSIRDGNVYHTTSHSTPKSLVYGAFTDDLNTLYVSTGGVAGLADVERARKVGRQNFFTYDAYARCDIVAGP